MSQYYGGCWLAFVVCVGGASSPVGGGGVVFAQDAASASPRMPVIPQPLVNEDGIPWCCAEDLVILRLRAADATRCTALPQRQREADDLCRSGWDPGSLLLEYDDVAARCSSCAAIMDPDCDALRRQRMALLEETFRMYGLDFHVNYWAPTARADLIRQCAARIASEPDDPFPHTAREDADICTLDPTAHMRCVLDVPGTIVEYIALLRATHAPLAQVQNVALFLARFAADPLPFVCEGCAAFTPLLPTAPRP